MPRIAIITGAARGIGKGIAERLARDGIRLAIADMNGEAALATAAELAVKYSIETLGTPCDVTVRADCARVVSETIAKFGGVDILVNNAGICPFIDIMEMDEATFRRTIDVNLIGAFHFTQLAAKEMIARGRGGRIVFITSLAVKTTSPMQGDYAASKAGLHMLMKSFASALGPHGITSNAVAPGMILTDMTKFHWEKPENAAHIKQRVPVGRIGTPADIGGAVALLVSEDAAYINGEEIVCDGGYTAVTG